MKETEKINVLNFNENMVCASVSPTEDISFEPSDGSTPSIIPLAIDKVRYMNNFSAFKSGILRFEESKQKEIYEEILDIKDWGNILTNQEINDIILHPTFEGLNKIIGIKDTSSFERVRGVYQKLRAQNDYDVSERVARIIQTRYRELLNKKTTTGIELTKKDIPLQETTEEVDKLKEQNIEMQVQLKEMQIMMEQMITNQANLSQPNQPDKDESDSKKAPGRPKKSNQ